MPPNGIRGSRKQESRRQALQNGGVGASNHGKARAKSKPQSSKKKIMISEDILEAERVKLLAERQTELEAVVENHDTLVCLEISDNILNILHKRIQVREMFHMDHFLMMVPYDPMVYIRNFNGICYSPIIRKLKGMIPGCSEM